MYCEYTHILIHTICKYIIAWILFPRDTENTRKGTFLKKRYLFGLGLIFLGLDQKSCFWCILVVLSQKFLVFAGAILCSNAILSLCCFWCVWRPAQGFLLSFFMIFYKRKGPEWWLWSFKYLVLERAKCLMIIADHLLLVGSGRAVMAVSLRKLLLIKLLVFSALLPWWQ